VPITVNPKDLGLKFARQLKPKKRRVLSKDDAKTEKPLQEACEKWLEDRGIVYLHIPQFLLVAGFTQGSNPREWGVRNNAAKDVRGFPDICIFHPNQKEYLAVELKSRTGVTTDWQNKWVKALGGHVFRNLPDFVAAVEPWLLIKPDH
jgi:hypothetical protein